MNTLLGFVNWMAALTCPPGANEPDETWMNGELLKVPVLLVMVTVAGRPFRRTSMGPAMAVPLMFFTVIVELQIWVTRFITKPVLVMETLVETFTALVGASLVKVNVAGAAGPEIAMTL